MNIMTGTMKEKFSIIIEASRVSGSESESLKE